MLGTCKSYFLAAAIVVLGMAGCAGSTDWAKHASAEDVRSASDFDLCRQYLVTSKLNENIGKEIVQRGLLTQDEESHLTGDGSHLPSTSNKKCYIFMNFDSWKEESKNVTAHRHQIEIWRTLSCLPSFVNWWGASCGYEEYTFEDNVRVGQVCHDAWLLSRCKKSDDLPPNIQP